MNIREIVESSAAEWRDTHDPDELQVCCPFCVENNETPDQRYRLGVNVANGLAHCFNCGWRSDDIIHTARELARVLDVDMMGERVTLQRTVSKPAPVKSERKKAILKGYPPGYEPFCFGCSFERPALDYLYGRGISEAQIRRWNIGWAIMGRYRYRVIVPVTHDGVIVGVVGRDYTGENELRYLNSESLRGVFGCKGGRTAVIVEGSMDALHCENVFRGDDSLCVFGSNISDEQMQILLRYERLTYLCDFDTAGCKGARINCAQIAEAGGTIYCDVPDRLDGSDPGSQSDEFLMQRKRRAVRWSTGVERMLKLREAFR